MSDVGAALANDAGGIGLFRSEFLYLEAQDYPTEEEQFQAYKTVAENMAGKRSLSAHLISEPINRRLILICQRKKILRWAFVRSASVWKTGDLQSTAPCDLTRQCLWYDLDHVPNDHLRRRSQANQADPFRGTG